MKLKLHLSHEHPHIKKHSHKETSPHKLLQKLKTKITLA